MVRIATAGVTTILCLAVFGSAALAQQTPPLTPKTVDTPTPPAPVQQTVPAPADVPHRPLTANEAARIAVVHQPTIEAAKQAVIAAKGRTEQVRAAMLPNVFVTGAYNSVQSLNTVNGQSSTVVGTFPGIEAAASLKQLIFDFEHTRELVRQSALLESVAQDALQVTRNDLVYQTKQAYYMYANTVRALKISQDTLANLQKELDLANARLRTGLGLPSDAVRAQTALAQGVTALTVARANASQARINLALVMGIDPRTPLDVTMDDEPVVSSSDQNAMVDLALKQRPDIREAADNVDSTRHGVFGARTTNAPVITGSLGLSSTGTSIPPRNDGFYIGVSLSWNPFDGGFTAGKVKEARANQAIAIANMQTAKLMVISDVSQAYIAMRDAEQRIVSARNAVTNALEDLRIAEGRFTNGLGLFLDITDAETVLESAQSDLTNAQFTVDQSRAALAHAVGTPVPATP